MSTERNNKIAILPIISGLVIVLILLGFGLFQLAAATPSKQECRSDDWRCNEIRQLEEVIGKNNLSNEMQRSLIAKLQALYFEATFQAEGVTKLTEMPTEAERARRELRTPKVPIKPKERLTGIIERPAVPLSQAFMILNAWQEMIDGRYLTVFAGGLSEDPDQGVIVIYDDSTEKYTIYTSPTKEGSFRIIAVEGLNLILETNQKTRLYFNVIQPIFADSMTKGGEATITPFTFPTATTTVVPTNNPYPSQ